MDVEEGERNPEEVKQEGNELFKEKRYEEAITKYAEATNLLQTNIDELDAKQRGVLVACCNNSAL